MQSILSPPTWRFWSRQLIICVWAQCKNIYLFICFVYSCQIRRSFEMFSGVTVLRSSPKFSIKTHCSQSWEEHRGMFNVRHLWTTHRRSATPNPKRVREWRASSFFSRVGKKYGNELWRRGGGLLQRCLCAKITTRCAKSVQTGLSACLQFSAICQI